MLVLTADETASLLDMRAVIEALEPVYQDMAEGRAGSVPRSDLLVPNGRPGAVHGLKTMSGCAPRYRTAAIRLNSDVIHWPVGEDGIPRRVKIPAAGPGRWVGLVLLFSTETGEPLAIFPDGHVQAMRVAAACAIAAKYMSRPQVRVMGLFGSGWQARAQVLAMAAVRPLARVQVWSPNPEHRASFARAMTEQVGVEVVAVDRPEAAADGADLVCAATSALGHVVRGEWVRAGMFLTCVRTQELAPEVYYRADRIVLHAREQAPVHVLVGLQEADLPELRQGWHHPAYEGFGWEQLPLLADLVSGRIPGRQSDDEVTVFVNNIGLGVQFAAVGAMLLERARQRGVGRELPTEWFLQDVHP